MSVLDYFSLNEQPFRIGPDPRFLYLSDQVKEALAKCEYTAACGRVDHSVKLSA
jgi:type II secretory pathway predicted ATPase ExeA